MKHYKDWVAIVWLLFTAYLASGADISCISQQNVVKGKSASLTCLYNQNLQREKQDFYIYRHHLGEDAVIVAICAWEESSLTCDFQPGYNASVHDNNVTLSISSVAEEHAGNYTCTTLPPKHGDKTNPCVLSVKGEVKRSTSKVSCFAPAHLSGDQPVPVTCIFPDSLNADAISLQLQNTHSSSKPVELVRCKRDGSCEVEENGCPVDTEHNPTDGFRIITAKVKKAGQYLCKATKHGKEDEICLAKVEKGQSDTSDGSLNKLTEPLYAILAFLIIAIIACVCVGAAVFVKRSNWCKNAFQRFRREEQGPSTEPLRDLNAP